MADEWVDRGTGPGGGAAPLEGLRVLDFGHYVAGPLLAVMLADQGADVIHVDSPRQAARQATSDAFLLRNKRRITLDLKSADDLRIAEELVSRADVLVENFRPGVMDRLGLGYARAHELAPGLVYCSLPGFAPDDPRAALPGWEGVIAAATGNTWIRAGQAPVGWDQSRPTYTAVPVASNFAAFLAASATVAALTSRLGTGQGQHVSVPLFSAMFEAIGLAGAYETEKGLPPPRPLGGNGSGTYRCADGRYVQFNPIGTSARFTRWLVDLAGKTSWSAEGLTDGLALGLGSPANDELCRRLTELFLSRPAKDWEDLAGPAGVPITMIRDVTEWAATDHARTSREVAEVEDPVFGTTAVAGFAVRSSAHEAHRFSPRHLPDEDRAGILAELERPARDPVEPRRPAGDQPYSGLNVVDLTEILAGPTSGKILAELGARVVKINSPRSRLQSHGVVNRGKETLLLDVESELGQQVFWKLVEDADVVVQNYPPGTAERYGIGYRHVAARRPEVIYVSVSCYGHGGEWEPRRGYETQGQAVTGVMARAGGDEAPEVLGPYNVLDFGTGVMTSFACALGIYQQAATGRGQHLTASLAQTGTYHQASFLVEPGPGRHDEARGPGALGAGPLYRLYVAADGWFFLAAPASGQRLVEVEGLAHLAAHLDGPAGELAAALERTFSTGKVETWVGALQAAGLGAHAVVALADLMVDPEVIRQGLSVTQFAEDVGEVRMPGVAMSLSATPARLGKAVRRPGRDAPAVLERLGLGDRLDAYERAWVLRVDDGPTGW